MSLWDIPLENGDYLLEDDFDENHQYIYGQDRHDGNRSDDDEYWSDYDETGGDDDQNRNNNDQREDFQDALFDGFTPSVNSLMADEEYESDPDEIDYKAKGLTRWEFCNQAFVLRNYCTNQQAREEYLKHKQEMEEEAKLNPPKPPEPVEPVEWVADDLYGSVVGPRGPVGPNPLEVDPSLPERDREPIVLTPEEEYYYGPLEPRNPPPEPEPAPPKLDNPEILHGTSSMAELSLNDAPQARQVEPLPDPGPVIPAGPMPEDPALLYFYDSGFRLAPGDVIIFTRPRLSNKPDEQGRHKLMNCVAIYEDVNYFEEYGTFRANFLDGYPLEEGDLVVRLGNFNRLWLWNRHPTINFYMYWPGLIPPLGYPEKLLHPWYWIQNGLLPYGGRFGMTLPIHQPVADAHMPIGTRVPDFTLRNGDIVIHHVMEPSKAPPFSHRLDCHVWNPILANIGVKRLMCEDDKVLRHGMAFQFVGIIDDHGVSVVTAHVELYLYDEDGCWRYMGRWTSKFEDHIQPEPRIRRLSAAPLAGDVVFDRDARGRMTRAWDPDLRIGGLVSFHEWEFWKEYGREGRPFVWFRDVGKYGMGNVTMVLRYGTFEDNLTEWTWHEGHKVELFILNTRGSAWRKIGEDAWPEDQEHPRPNYSWQQYNPHDLEEVSPDFEPKFGDIIVRMRESSKKMKIQNPVYSGVSHNPHFDTKIQMSLLFPNYASKKGDVLIRAGYEKNHNNPTWTNTTVEVYFFEEIGNVLKWRFKGRDMFIYGTNYLFGGLKDVQHSGVGDLRVSDIQMINDSKTRAQFGRFR